MRDRRSRVARTDVRCAAPPHGKRRAALETYLQDVIRASFQILPYDEAAAGWHGRERSRLGALGRPAPFVVGQIAAIAHANDLILATVNPKDFSSFNDLEVENWAK
jgi:tRNA(fMet)-specific endonuclease VapC